jgi:hypothetical protein
MYIKLNVTDNISGSGSGSWSGSYIIENNDTYNDNNATYNYEIYDEYKFDKKSPINTMRIFTIVMICFACCIFPYFYDNIREYYLYIKQKCGNITCANFKKWTSMKKIQPTPDVLPTIQTHDIEGDCAICLEKNNRKSIKLCCNHTFHEKCIRTWATMTLETRYNVLCPLCRDVIY